MMNNELKTPGEQALAECGFSYSKYRHDYLEYDYYKNPTRGEDIDDSDIIRFTRYANINGNTRFKARAVYIDCEEHFAHFPLSFDAQTARAIALRLDELNGVTNDQNS